MQNSPFRLMIFPAINLHFCRGIFQQATFDCRRVEKIHVFTCGWKLWFLIPCDFSLTIHWILGRSNDTSTKSDLWQLQWWAKRVIDFQWFRFDWYRFKYGAKPPTWVLLLQNVLQVQQIYNMSCISENGSYLVLPFMWMSPDSERKLSKEGAAILPANVWGLRALMFRMQRIQTHFTWWWEMLNLWAPLFSPFSMQKCLVHQGSAKLAGCWVMSWGPNFHQ